MTISNRKIGGDFEQEVADYLSAHDFWVHRFAQNPAGQPADIIAVKNKKAYLIDCKVCLGGFFQFSRIEPNQETAMALWESLGNGFAWFALSSGGAIWMLNHSQVELYHDHFSGFTESQIENLAIPINRWVELCGALV